MFLVKIICFNEKKIYFIYLFIYLINKYCYFLVIFENFNKNLSIKFLNYIVDIYCNVKYNNFKINIVYMSIN